MYESLQKIDFADKVHHPSILQEFVYTPDHFGSPNNRVCFFSKHFYIPRALIKSFYFVAESFISAEL